MINDILNECGLGGYNLEIKNVVASNKENRITGTVEAGELVPVSKILKVNEVLANRLKMNVDLNIHFSSYSLFLGEDNSEFLRDFISSYFDGLSKVEVELKEDTYFISAKGALKSGIETDVEQMFESFFGDKPKIVFNAVEPETDVKPLQAPVKKVKAAKKDEDTAGGNIIYGKALKNKEVLIKDLQFGKVKIAGEIFRLDKRELPKSGKVLFNFGIKDESGTIGAKFFVPMEKANGLKIDKKLNGAYLNIYGRYCTDKFTGANVVEVTGLEEAQNPNTRQDNHADGKRVELHLHTQMSAMDGMIDVKKLIKTAQEFGHKAVAITDHGVVQSFPEAYFESKGKDLKIIYGVEGYLLDDEEMFIAKCNDESIDSDIVVFDIETTGLDFLTEKITEIGAVKIHGGKIVESFHSLVNPQKPIPARITELTGITNDMVKNAPLIDAVLDDFYEFCKGCSLSAHNASFDTGFIYYNDKQGRFTMPVLDTLPLSRVLLPELKNHKLDTLTKHFSIVLESHHRADHDAKATGELLLELLNMFKDKGLKTFEEVNKWCMENGGEIAGDTYHVILLAKNIDGLKNIYKMVSDSHLKYFYKKPRIPKSMLKTHREGVLVGSACERGELFRSIVNKKSGEEIKDIANFYDYLEIQPTANNLFLVRNGKVESEKALQEINMRIYELGKELKKPVVATCDAHFLNEDDQIFRQVILTSLGFKDSENDTPLYFRTTDEMLKEFSYMGSSAAREVVIENTNKIADLCCVEKPFLDGKTYTPTIDGAEDEITKLTYDKAHELYGETIPDIIQKRIDKELNSINKYGYAVLYLIAQKLVKKSLEDGYLVGSRGSVGSSFVAYLCGITEVNPLPPHYICKHCKTVHFDVDADKYPCGKDLEDKKCEHCGEILFKDGYDIPFEVFLGFEGDKVPDIDLNFSGDYQPKAHKYIEELFGEGHVFRAGTVSTLKDKTAYGFVRKFEEEKGLIFSDVHRNWLVSGCMGVKRTTGQHPGGIVIVPKEYDVYDFTPIQHPADSKDKGVITTHFDFNSMHDILVKVDALGHDDPTMLRELQDATGIDPKSIPLDDKKTMSIFSSTEALGVNPADIKSKVGTFGIPEFGTPFVRGILNDTLPNTMAELVRISGISHGTDVWTNNAQDLVKKGVCTLSEAICTRDDIMNYLIKIGVDAKIAFDIMEKVRKGKGKDLSPEYIKAMEDANVASWYVESCKKIGYMFPKAHAAAYVMMAFRIAWFKVHKPEFYYAAYFSRNIESFDFNMVEGGADEIRRRIDEINAGGSLSVNDKAEVALLEILLEMLLRGFKMLPVSLEKSQASKFFVEDGGIRMPFRAVPGLGDSVAEAIIKEREKKPFMSVEDLKKRTKLNNTTADVMQKAGFIEGLSATNQLSFF